MHKDLTWVQSFSWSSCDSSRTNRFSWLSIHFYIWQEPIGGCLWNGCILKGTRTEYPADFLRACSVLESGFFGFLVSLAGSQRLLTSFTTRRSTVHTRLSGELVNPNLRSCMEALESLLGKRLFSRATRAFLACTVTLSRNTIFRKPYCDVIGVW